jgi:hypothetical protein
MEIGEQVPLDALTGRTGQVGISCPSYDCEVVRLVNEVKGNSEICDTLALC